MCLRVVEWLIVVICYSIIDFLLAAIESLTNFKNSSGGDFDPEHAYSDKGGFISI